MMDEQRTWQYVSMTSFDAWMYLMVLTKVGGRDSGLKFADELYNYGRKSQSQRVAMFKITRGLLEFPMASTVAHPTAKGYSVTPTSFTNSDAAHAVTNWPSQIGLSHFGTNYRLR